MPCLALCVQAFWVMTQMSVIDKFVCWALWGMLERLKCPVSHCVIAGDFEPQMAGGHFFMMSFPWTCCAQKSNFHCRTIEQTGIVRLSRKFLFKGMFELSSQKCLFFHNVDLNQIWNCIFYSRVKLVSRQCKLQRCWQTETAYAAVRCKYQRRIIHLMITCAVPFAQFEHLQETIRHTKMHIYKHAQVFYISTRVHVM